MGECVLGEPSFFGTRQKPAVLVAEEAFSLTVANFSN